MPENEAEKRKHLILFLSNLPRELEKHDGIPQGLQLTNNIYSDIKTIEELKDKQPPLRWQWEMPIRGIMHHLSNTEEMEGVKSVTLICSKESLGHAHLFINICKKYKQLNEVAFHVLAQKNHQTKLIDFHTKADVDSAQGYDFEAFDELSYAFWILLGEFKKKKYHDHETMIDITSGQKPNSIVAATMTFNRNIKAQYVQTNRPWNVISYDLIMSFSNTDHLGV